MSIPICSRCKEIITQDPALGRDRALQRTFTPGTIRLMGAASDLLEASKDVVARWDSPDWKWDEHTGVLIDRLRAAIAKAEGSEP